jgi:hypothetical protein
VVRAAELLTNSMDASARLCLLEALSEAAAEITAKLGSATVDVRLRGREADLTVTEAAADASAPPSPMPATDTGDLARITLRLPEQLKEQAERAAAAEGVSVNAWLVRAVAAALTPGRGAPSVVRTGRRLTGFAQA